MGRPHRRTAGFAAAAVLTVLFPACTPRSEPPAAPEPSPPPAPAPGPTILVPPPPLARPELLQAVAAAASAADRGAYPDVAAELAGERFVLRLPFGCAGPSPEGAAHYTFDGKSQALKLSVRPETWTDAPWARALVGSPETEAIEGFWIRRPWRVAEDCPAAAESIGAAAPAGEAAPSPETVGLAQVFEQGGSRVLRRGSRAYEATKKLGEGEPPAPGGFRLVLEGRIAAPADHRPVRCRSAHPDQRPTCLVMVELDRVALEDTAGAKLAEWRN